MPRPTVHLFRRFRCNNLFRVTINTYGLSHTYRKTSQTQARQCPYVCHICVSGDGYVLLCAPLLLEVLRLHDLFVSALFVVVRI